MGECRELSESTLAAEEQRLRAAYAQRSRSSFLDPGHLFGEQERERHALELLTEYRVLPLEDKSILDVGCGSGAWILQFLRWGARADRLAGVDVRPETIARARERVPAGVRLDLANAARLPYPDNAFDLVMQATVFTSVLDDDVRRKMASEMVRIVKPNGMIMWYDFSMNNPSNPNVRRVTKREIFELFSGCRIDLRRVSLAPPLRRRFAPYSWLVTYLLGQIPPLCTHCIGAITKA
jgi:ubiquinone/menaquinone biosynthesis C-methylase UbiE